jgi:D-alanyl-D-alanine dipeptidase
MSYYSEKKNIKETDENKTVAVATYEVGAEVIVKALNFYFGDNYTRNESVEMMHQNTANALKSIADFLEKHEYTGEMAIEYLREVSEELEAQALVVSMRDELKFDKPKYTE